MPVAIDSGHNLIFIYPIQFAHHEIHSQKVFSPQFLWSLEFGASSPNLGLRLRHRRPRPRRTPRLTVRRPVTGGVRVPDCPGLIPAPADATTSALWLGVVLWADTAVVAPVVADRVWPLGPAGCAGRGGRTRLILRMEFAETNGLGS